MSQLKVRGEKTADCCESQLVSQKTSAEFEEVVMLPLQAANQVPNCFENGERFLFSPNDPAFCFIIDQTVNDLIVVDSATLRLRYASKGYLSHSGYGEEDIDNLTLFNLCPEYDVPSFRELARPLLMGETSQARFETVCNRKDGSYYPVDIWLQYRSLDGGIFFALIRDISMQRQTEVKLRRRNHFYSILNLVNQAIVQIQNETELFARVCNVLLELENVCMAWIGKLDSATELVVPIAAAGQQQHYLSGLTICVDPSVPEGRGPCGTALRENRIIAVNDFQTNPMMLPWQDKEGRRFGWQSMCSVPITLSHMPYAVINLYSDQSGYFDTEVLDLLTELSLDISFALNVYERDAVRRSAERKMMLWAKVFSQNREAVVILDRYDRVISVNNAFTRITGFSENEVLGRNARLFSLGMQNPRFYRALRKNLRANDFWQGELNERKKDGALFTEWLSVSVVRDENDAVANFIAIFSDITQLKTAKQQIEHMAHYDALTGLPNRLLLKARIDHDISVSERHKRSFALFFIDLDHFKNINDALGHSVGDEVLIEVGKRMQQAVRAEDTVSRIGGDEFNIHLPDTDWQGAAIVAKKILLKLAEAIQVQHYSFFVHPSIGISLFPENGHNFEMLARSADTALYKAKECGRNQYQFFTSEMQRQTLRRMELERHLHNALENGEFALQYQPFYNAYSRRITGAEALLRWYHPQLGAISPGEFVPIAEESGLILPIGDWVLEHAILQGSRWRDEGHQVHIAVNLSLAQFRANALPDTVRDLLEKYQLPPDSLELELTESLAMNNVEAAIKITRQLCELGVQIAIDDFGTGFSSLSYLQKLSLTKLKIDKSFTLNMTSSKESENIVDAIIGLAKSLNMATIAEGVESDEQYQACLKKDCDEIQGFYFSPPVNADEFTRMLQKQAITP